MNFFFKNFIFSVKSTISFIFQDQMYIFGYKTTVFIQNLYISVKLFCKNVIFSVKSTIFYFSGPNVHFWVQNYSFYSNLYILVKYFDINFIFRVKSTNVLFFQDQIYIFGYKTTLFIHNFYILVKSFGKTSFLV